MEEESNPYHQSRRVFIRWLWRLPVVIALFSSFVGLIWGVRVHFSKPPARLEPRFSARDPQKILGNPQLSEPWDSHEFEFAGWFALLIRVPKAQPGGLSLDADSHFIAFNRRCTHQGCPVTLNSDLEAIAFAFNHRRSTPALTCRCHFSVFDALKAGRAVSGPARLPLQRVQLELRDSSLWAVGIEVGSEGEAQDDI